MKDVKEYQEIVSKTIEDFKVSNGNFSLYAPVNYIMSLGGKRIRPVLTLIGADIFDGDLQRVAKPSLGIEVFHNFTLLHDDIMDDAPLRRGKETVHVKWDENAAILSGDVMFVQAFSFVTSCPDKYLRSVMDLFNVTAIEVCEGQQLDMDFETRDDVSIEEYIEMITLKTSVLLGCALKLGAVLSDASSEDSDLIYDFGKNLGIAFQIKDDLLDVYGDAAMFGKQVGGDILANKKTYLLLKAFEQVDDETKIELQRCLDNEVGSEKVEKVRAIFDLVGVSSIAEDEMERFYQIAVRSVHQMSVSEDKKGYLLGFAETIMNRVV